MALDNDVIRARLKETFGAEQQEVTAGRLNVVQGTISKVLSGNQTLTLEMAYHIALSLMGLILQEFIEY